tara:strand:+ start:33 stop:1334 length:1302 start_codon:yes stop_codon:yes gene_type:complete
MSNSIAVQQKRFIQLAPSNNSSSGYGPIGSQPIIRFSVADTQALALLKDARLNATITVTKDGGTGVALTDDINIDPVLGMCSVMDQVIVSSRRFGTQIEQVVNLGRLESAYYRSRYSPKMMASHAYHETKAVGLGRYNRWAGTTVASSQTTDIRAVASRKSITSSQEISLPFHVGMFLTDSPTDLSAVGGLELAVYLQKPEAMFFGTDAASMNYTLTNVSLTVPLLYKSAEMIAQTPPESVIEFLNWTSMYSVLDSTQSSIAQRLYLTGLVAGIHNSLPTKQLNSYSANQFGLKSIGVERLTFLRDGQRAPLEKTMIVQDDRVTTRSVEDQSTTYPEVLREYLSAWGPVRELKYSQVIPELVKGIADRSGVVGIGCNFSPEASGVNISGVLSIDVQSRLQDSADSSLIQPYALFSFYLSRQAFVASPAGLKAL